MRPLKLSLLFVILILASSWGFLGHKTIHQLAVYELPSSIQGFFFKHVGYFVKHAGRPDKRRYVDSTEAPKHFINIEAYGDNAINTMPMQWKDALEKYSLDTLKKYGYVPYEIIFMKQKLTNAFKNLKKDSILFYANDMAHYIGDANVPLHTTMNHDGQLSNQKGIHALWETMILELELDHFNLYSKHKAIYLKSPETAVWTALRRANALLPDLFAQEIEVSKQFTEEQKFRTQKRKGVEVKYYKPEFAKAYFEALKPTINDQLLHAADLIADMWYTAWVDAGKPDLSELETLTTEEEDKLKQEMNSFKNNTLIQDSLLLSKKKDVDDGDE
jgi:hypothetical protein